VPSTAAPGVALSLSSGEIHKQDSLHLYERLAAKDHAPRILRRKGHFVAEKLVSSISPNCHFTVGRRRRALHLQAVDVIVADGDQKRLVSPSDTALCRFHLYAPPGPQGWAK
jgi:hypothetical protein